MNSLNYYNPMRHVLIFSPILHMRFLRYSEVTQCVQGQPASSWCDLDVIPGDTNLELPSTVLCGLPNKETKTGK